MGVGDFVEKTSGLLRVMINFIYKTEVCCKCESSWIHVSE